MGPIPRTYLQPRPPYRFAFIRDPEMAVPVLALESPRRGAPEAVPVLPDV